MANITYNYDVGNAVHSLNLPLVEGTHGRPYTFGEGEQRLSVEIPDFFIATVPVTQALWTHVMGNNPSINRSDNRPVENVSWLDVTQTDGFLDHINASPILAEVTRQLPNAIEARFRLPSETEWEYAARGGPFWKLVFKFSGSDDVEAVAWYQLNSGDSSHEVAQKAANQLGIYDMSGNIWEWCQDSLTRDVQQIPTDGSAFASDSPERILRGGCFHNWAIHCTVSKRYAIGHQCHDGCIGFRLVLSAK
jgi:formylglycine-generating enzyme